jgi:methionyl-tRNA formyltransferase
MSPYPTAFTQFMNKDLKIYDARKEDTEPEIPPGAFLTDGKTYLKFASKNGFITVKEIQQEGKKRMKIDEFLRGVRP